MTADWPDRLLDIPQPQRDRWREVDPDRYWAQLRAERRQEASVYVATELAEKRAQRREQGRPRRGFWRRLVDLASDLADW